MELGMNHLIIFIFCVIAPSLLCALNDQSDKEKAEKCPELTGRVVWPKDADFDKARLVSNYYASKNKFPKAIVYCQNTKDVQNAVKWARCNNVSIRVRSGGHNHEAYSTGNDVLLIDVSNMNKVDIDKEKHIITVQPGITSGALYALLFKEGLTQVGGTCADVGISGVVLTGGIGPLLRINGMSCDNLLSFEMVAADGEVLQISPDNKYSDLFWAACGGGAGNFGVVTSLVLKVHPAGKVTWFNIGWDWSQPVEKVITVWQDLFSNGDKKWFSHLDVWAKVFPVDKFKKQPIKALGVYYGTPEEAKKDLAPLLNIGKPADQTIELVNWDRAIKEFEEATSVYITDKPEYKSPGAYAMQPLPPEAIKIVVETLQDTSTPLLNFLMFSLGGAAQNISPTSTAYFWRNAKYLVVYSTQWLQEKDDVKYIKELDAFRDRLLPYTKGDYLGNPDRNLKDYMADYYGDNVHRLRCIKKKYDPQNLFQYEQSIPPSTESCKEDLISK